MEIEKGNRALEPVSFPAIESETCCAGHVRIPNGMKIIILKGTIKLEKAGLRASVQTIRPPVGPSRTTKIYI